MRRREAPPGLSRGGHRPTWNKISPDLRQAQKLAAPRIKKTGSPTVEAVRVSPVVRRDQVFVAEFVGRRPGRAAAALFRESSHRLWCGCQDRPGAPASCER